MAEETHDKPQDADAQVTEETTQEQGAEETGGPEYENTVTIEEAGPCRKKVTVEIPAEAVKAALNEQFAELRRDAIVPGFRRGRAPLRLVEKRFGTDVREQVKLKLMAEASEKALKDHEIRTLGDPDMDPEAVELPEDGPLTFSLEADVWPEFELPALEGIPVERPKVEVADEHVDSTIEDMRRRLGVWVPKDGKVAAEDMVVADVRIGVEGVDEDDKRDNVEIQVRPRGFVGPIPVEGLDTLLAGAKAGDVKTTDVEVAETFFDETYRGKTAHLEITIQEVKALKPADLDEEFLKAMGADDEEDLRDRIREQFQDRLEQEVRQGMASQVRRYLTEQTTLELPARLVAEQAQQLLQRRFVQLLMQGQSREEIEQQMQQLQAASDREATEQLKEWFVMEKVAETLGVEVSEEEVNGYVAQMAIRQGKRPERMREELARDGSLTQFRMEVREQKCIEKLLETAKVTEISAKEAEEKAKAASKAKEKAETTDKGKAKAASKAKEEDAGSDAAAVRKKTAARRTRKSSQKDDKEAK